MTTLETQIEQALAKIPHATDCDSHDGYPMVSGLGEIEYPCSCDRAQRVAQAVARAIEAAVQARVDSDEIGTLTGYPYYHALKALEAAA